MKSVDGHCKWYHINYCLDNTIPGKLSCVEASREGLPWSMGLRLNFRALRNYIERNREVLVDFTGITSLHRPKFG